MLGDKGSQGISDPMAICTHIMSNQDEVVKIKIIRLLKSWHLGMFFISWIFGEDEWII